LDFRPELLISYNVLVYLSTINLSFLQMANITIPIPVYLCHLCDPLAVPTVGGLAKDSYCHRCASVLGGCYESAAQFNFMTEVSLRVWCATPLDLPLGSGDYFNRPYFSALHLLQTFDRPLKCACGSAWRQSLQRFTFAASFLRFAHSAGLMPTI
jgi:hypothetical protein